jgi:hypothetical protein
MSKSVKARFGITMSPELLERIEEKRGLVPRARYIEYSLKQYFDLQSLREDEVKFYDEILAMLPKEETFREETTKDYNKLGGLLESIRSKLAERKNLMTESIKSVKTTSRARS